MNTKKAFGIAFTIMFFLALVAPVQTSAYGIIGQALTASGIAPGAGLQNPYASNYVTSYRNYNNGVQHNLIVPQYQNTYLPQAYYPAQTYYASSWTCGMGYYTAACGGYYGY